MEKNVIYALSGLLGFILALSVLLACLSYNVNQLNARVALLETFHEEEILNMPIEVSRED